MTLTRYSTANIILLIAEAVVCTVTAFVFIMTAGFGADPGHDFRSWAVECMILVGLLSCPSFLVMFRWSGIGSTVMWCAAICTLVLALLGGQIQHMLGLPILMLIQALICGAINSGSRDRPGDEAESRS